MSGDHNWAEALNISKAQIQIWQEQLPEGEDLLFWLLQKGHVNESKYLQWAREEFSLASLESDFYDEFKTHSPPAYLKSLNYWSLSVCPLLEWDGVIFVACLCPPPQLLQEPNIQFVLAPPSLLEQLWDHFNTTGIHEEFAEIPPTPDRQTQVTELPDLNTLQVEEDNKMPEESGIQLVDEDSPRDSAPADLRVVEPKDLRDDDVPAPPKEEAPDGLDFSKVGGSPAPADLDPGEALFFNEKDESNSNKAERHSPEDLKEGAQESPEGILVDDVMSKVDSSIPEGLGDMNKKPKDNIFAFPSPEEETKTQAIEQTQTEAIQQTKTVDLQNTQAAQVEPESDNTKTMDLQIKKRHDQDHEATSPIATGNHKPAKVYTGPANIEDCSTFEEVVEWLFQQTTKHYKAAMLFQFERGKPKAWKWDENWEDNGQSALLYDLSTPSIFRIITQTKKPFHGPIRPSPVNEQFFKAWGYDQLPKIVSAIPIKKYKRISAILLCVGDESSESLDALSSLLELGEKVSNYLKTAQRRVG